MVTAASSTALHPLFNTKHIFGEVIKISPLTKERRRDVSDRDGSGLMIDSVYAC